MNLLFSLYNFLRTSEKSWTTRALENGKKFIEGEFAEMAVEREERVLV